MCLRACPTEQRRGERERKGNRGPAMRKKERKKVRVGRRQVLVFRRPARQRSRWGDGFGGLWGSVGEEGGRRVKKKKMTEKRERKKKMTLEEEGGRGTHMKRRGKERVLEGVKKSVSVALGSVPMHPDVSPEWTSDSLNHRLSQPPLGTLIVLSLSSDENIRVY